MHHIIPKHMGGTDDPSNLIELTVKDHAEAHLWLWLKYSNPKDKLAWKGLSGQLNKEEIIKESLSIGGIKGGNSTYNQKVGLFAMTKEKKINALKKAGQAQGESGQIQALGKKYGKTNGKKNGKKRKDNIWINNKIQIFI